MQANRTENIPHKIGGAIDTWMKEHEMVKCTLFFSHHKFEPKKSTFPAYDYTGANKLEIIECVDKNPIYGPKII